jgi:hypothetical protein
MKSNKVLFLIIFSTPGKCHFILQHKNLSLFINAISNWIRKFIWNYMIKRKNIFPTFFEGLSYSSWRYCLWNGGWRDMGHRKGMGQHGARKPQEDFTVEF